MENYQAWAEETLKKVREKMAWRTGNISVSR